jgi:hypothetical protein
MRKALPVMTEDADLLKPRLQQERDGRNTPRLQRRYVLARGPAQTRMEAAPLLGVHRHPIGHGLTRDEGGGWEAWRPIHRPAGKRLSLPPEGLAAIAQALRQPAGLASDDALRQGGQQT